MATAVARLPNTAQLYGGHGQASQDALLDALLVSCEKPSTNPPLESFGRDLKPYFPIAKNTSIPSLKKSIASAKKNTKTKVSPPPVAAAAAAAAASTKQSAAQINDLRAESKKTAHMKGRVAAKKDGDVAKKDGEVAPAPLQHRGAALSAGATEHLHVYLPWAGPGFYVSPSPDKLPSPTHFLLG